MKPEPTIQKKGRALKKFLFYTVVVALVTAMGIKILDDVVKGKL